MSKEFALKFRKLFKNRQIIYLRVIEFQYLPAGRQASANFSFVAWATQKKWSLVLKIKHSQLILTSIF